ncbi:MAG: ATP-grasp domain-containing protein [Roseicyclus sp.]
MSGIRAQLMTLLAIQPQHAGHLMDLAVVEQIRGNLPLGLSLQSRALDLCQMYAQRGRTGKTRLLVLAAPIEMGGNTPVDFLTENPDFEVVTWYFTGARVRPSDIPEHDVMFIAAPGDRGRNEAYLDAIAQVVALVDTPVLNAPERIMRLDRGSLGEVFGDRADIRCPRTVTCSRDELRRLAAAGETAEMAERIGPLPWVVRPLGCHAGEGLERIADLPQLGDYLARHGHRAFFLSEFVDYATPEDGLYRKYRVAFVANRAFPCHMAISEAWALWYLNAGMDASAQKRAEERAFMDGFRTGFGQRHEAALDALSRRLGLDYFGIDCAEDRDGRLVVFEADNALLVHAMDPPHLFPYKKPHMSALFAAFQDMLRAAAGRSGATGRQIGG